MSLAGKIRKIHGARDIAELEEFCRQNQAECVVRVAEIRFVEDFLDKIDAAVAASDYGLAQQLLRNGLQHIRQSKARAIKRH